MDKLEAVRLASLNLDSAADDELRAHQAWLKARDRLTEADRDYNVALDALHEARPPGTDHDAQAPASLERTG